MDDDLFLRYGRAVFEALRAANRRDDLLLEIEKLAKDAPVAVRAADIKPLPDHRNAKYRGVIGEVAKRLGLSTSFVSQVLAGRSTSAKVTAALREAMENRNEMDIPLGLQVQMLTAEERRKFLIGGAYHGLATEVARRLGLSRGRIRGAMRGDSPTDRILLALRQAMAEADAKQPDFAAASPRPLSVAEQKLFQRGGPYYGLQSQVAKKLGLGVCAVSNTCRGRNAKAETLIALRVEMACVDEGLQSREAAK